MITAQEQLDGLRKACGYIENGTSQPILIFQDDATKEWIANVNQNPHNYGKQFYDKSFSGLLQKLAFHYKEQ